MWSTICSMVPHWQFGEGAKPHLCMDEWNRSTPVSRWLSLSQDVWGKLVPAGLALVLGIKSLSLEVLTVLHVAFMVCRIRNAYAKFGKVV